MFDKDTQLYTNDCISDNECAFIARPQENHNVRIVMVGISEEEELQLRQLKSIKVVRNKIEFNIEPTQCFHIGEYDFTPNNPQLKETEDLFTAYTIRHFIPTNWDYNTNTYVSTYKLGKWYDTSNPVNFLPYLYASIGKPERVAIFKEFLDPAMIKKIKEKTKEAIDNKKKKDSEGKKDSTYNKYKKYQTAKRRKEFEDKKLTSKVNIKLHI